MRKIFDPITNTMVSVKPIRVTMGNYPKTPKPVNPITIVNGQAEWTQIEGDKYVVIGKNTKGGKVRIESDNFRYVSCINVYQGRLYLIRNSKKFLIKTIYN